mmetsp:Transcript_30286/g.59310  ORF Transcript_30286/g.59310 Transcript_30286/m.59310 type:complete len:171 (-) Transcript_30286:150-662(-)
MVLSRFTNPKIDDKGLPLADAMVVLSSTMILGIFILTQGIIKPSWLAPMSLAPQWRSLPFLFPALLHGSLLSMCWVIGGLAAQAYERESFSEGAKALKATTKTWAFAVALMIFGVQLGLGREALHMGVLPLVGESEALDMLAVSKYSELIVDAALVGLFMTVWRQIRARA